MTAQAEGPNTDLVIYAARIIAQAKQVPHSAPYHWAAALWEAGMLVGPGTSPEAASCRQCEHGGHTCYGCGIGMPHGEYACARCAAPDRAGTDTAHRDGLRRAILDLHVPWYEINGRRHDHLVLVGEEDLPAGHVCRTDEDDYPCDPPESHEVPACAECRWTTEDGDPAFPLWPCRTAALAAEPVPGAETDEAWRVGHDFTLWPHSGRVTKDRPACPHVDHRPACNRAEAGPSPAAPSDLTHPLDVTAAEEGETDG